MTDIDILSKSHLFGGIERHDIERMMTCLGTERKTYEKGQTVFWEGDEVTKVGIVLSGSARSIKTDPSGKTVIMALLKAGDYMGILLAASSNRKSPVTVQATDRLSVLFLPMARMLAGCGCACACHTQLLRNILDGIAHKALELHDRNNCLIKPTVRDKVLTYLTRAANEKGSRSFSVPLDRGAMAEYLNVDRSALSRELSNMKKDGLIDYYKNSFKLFT